jgi:hypothetical protein
VVDQKLGALAVGLGNDPFDGDACVDDEPCRRIAASPFITPFTKEHLRRGVCAPGGHRTDSRSQLFEGSPGLRRKRLAKNFAMLGFGRAAVLGRAQFESRDEFLVEVADD